MITKEDLNKAFQKVSKALEKDESINILMALDDFQSLMLTLGFTKQDSTFFIIGDAISTLSYHLKDMYSRFVPGVVPKEILSNATSRIRKVLNNVRKCLFILQKEMLEDDKPDYKAILEAIGQIYLESYEMFKFRSSYVFPSEFASE